MDKDFYKDLEKIKTIGSTYMAAVGLAPTAGTKVSVDLEVCPVQGLGPGSVPSCPGFHGQAPCCGPQFFLCIGLGSSLKAVLSVASSL